MEPSSGQWGQVQVKEEPKDPGYDQHQSRFGYETFVPYIIAL